MSMPYPRNDDENLTRTSPQPHHGSQSAVKSFYNGQVSPNNPPPKSVAFELLFPNSPHYKARLPMRVQIYPHDATESIVTTVKNFYGLYNNPGQGLVRAISFEDKDGNTLIARYENLSNGMTVYVRVSEEPINPPGIFGHPSYQTGSSMNSGYYEGDGHRMPPPQPAQALSYGQPASRPASRASHNRSVSPTRGRRKDIGSGEPILPTKKARSRSGYKSRGSSTHGGSFENIHSDGLNGYSSGDGGPGSVSSRTNMGNTEISLDNIVEGGRRKRAKFESSELPLFAPPQMPAATSNSSVSPVRRIENHRASYPFTHAGHHPFTNPQPLQSPQSYSNGFGQPGLYATPANGSRRDRDGEPSSRNSYGSTPVGNSSGILPTPDPTVGSCMSEEDKDVALQLMRLGEMSNISHGRTSASTLDDTFSGRADATSSAGVTSESESEPELPLARRQKREPSPILPPGMYRRLSKPVDNVLPSQESTDSLAEDEYDDGRDMTFKPETQDEFMNDMNQMLKPKLPKSKIAAQIVPKPRSSLPSGSNKVIKPPIKPLKSRSAPSGSSKPKTKGPIVPGSRPPISPTSLPSQSRKASVSSALNFQHQLGEDEEDLSSKPRCQRCRKSKKGCDRQRPCQRCKDAGLSADQCVSEDEGNGRKGRYGRHMGVPVKKDDIPIMNGQYTEIPVGGLGHPSDKNKKRKR